MPTTQLRRLSDCIRKVFRSAASLRWPRKHRWDSRGPVQAVFVPKHRLFFRRTLTYLLPSRTLSSRKLSVTDLCALRAILVKLRLDNSDFMPVESTENLQEHLRGNKKAKAVFLFLLHVPSHHPAVWGLAIVWETIPSRSPMSAQMLIQTQLSAEI